MNAQPNRATPSPADFYEFAASRRTLLTENIPAAIRSVRSHGVYSWLRCQPRYREAERELVKTPAFRAQVSPPGAPHGAAFPNDWELLWFASLVSQALGEYFQARINHHRQRVVTRADCRRAAKAADALRELIEKGLEIGGPPGTTSGLYDLLEKVPHTPARFAVASLKAGKHVPVMVLSRVLCLLIEGHYESKMAPIIHKIVQIVEPSIEQRTVRRHLQTVRPVLRTDHG